MTVTLIVCSTVPDETDRPAFDAWYQDDHMADVIKTFHPVRAWRSWSLLDPAVHYAHYEFAERTHLDQMMSTEKFQALVDDFSATWEGKVTRVRDITKTVPL